MDNYPITCVHFVTERQTDRQTDAQDLFVSDLEYYVCGEGGEGRSCGYISSSLLSWFFTCILKLIFSKLNTFSNKWINISVKHSASSIIGRKMNNADQHIKLIPGFKTAKSIRWKHFSPIFLMFFKYGVTGFVRQFLKFFYFVCFRTCEWMDTS